MISKTAYPYFSFQNPFQKLSQQRPSREWDGKPFPHRKTLCIMRLNDSKETSQIAQGITSTLMDFIEHPHSIPVVGDNNVAELATLLYNALLQYPEIDMIFSIGEPSTRIAQ